MKVKLRVRPRAALGTAVIVHRPIAVTADYREPVNSSTGERWAVALMSTVAAAACAALVTSTGRLLETTAAVAALTLVLFVSAFRGSRYTAVLGLVLSIPLGIDFHLTYRPDYIGVDGITIDAVDLWLVWLAWHYWRLRVSGVAISMRGVAIFTVPLAVWFAADLLSLLKSGDLVLSLYGLWDHLRGFVLLLLLPAILRQGEHERQAVFDGATLSAVFIGTVCIAESWLGRNFREIGGLDTGLVFRAAGFNTPTHTAGYLAVLIPLLLVQLIAEYRTAWRIIRLAALMLALAGIVSTLTRAPLVILALVIPGLLIYCAALGSVQWRTVLLLLAISGVLLFLASGRLADRVAQEPDNLLARGELAITAWNMAKHSPAVGQGINNYTLKMAQFSSKRELHTFEYIVHNKFLLTLAETGFIGLAALVVFLAAALRAAISMTQARDLTAIGLLGALLVIVFDMNVEAYNAGMVVLNAWVVISLVAALWSEASGRLDRRAILLPEARSYQ